MGVRTPGHEWATVRLSQGAPADPPQLKHLAWLNALPFCHDDGLRFFVHAGIDLTVPLAAQAPEVMVWMREPFLSECDAVDCGRFVVHGHTPLPGGTPDLRRRRVNLDTAAVMGGPLTAAVFDHTQAPPLGFLTDVSQVGMIGVGGRPSEGDDTRAL